MGKYEVQRLVEKAKQGNVDAREQLIKRYLDLVSREIEEYQGIFEKEDLYQEAIVFLIMKINHFLKGNINIPIYNYLANNVRNYFDITVPKLERQYQKMKSLDLHLLNDESNKEIMGLELVLSVGTKTKDN